MQTNDYIKRHEYGDWQTNLSLTVSICEYIKSLGISPQVIVEPTCGVGNFIIAALRTFDEIEEVYGIEINESYLDIFKENLKSEKKNISQVQINLFNENIFEFDFLPIKARIKGKTVLAIGNPPWVTSSKLGEWRGENLPQKSNCKGLRGLDAVTGKGNFDVAEYISTKVVKQLSDENVYFAFLLKNSVVKNLMYGQKECSFPLSLIRQFVIDTHKEFSASVAASMLFMRLWGGAEQNCEVRDFYSKKLTRSLGWFDGKFVADIESYKKTCQIDGKCQYEWRSGIKHDCSKVIELEMFDGVYKNALGEKVNIEEDLVFPLLKSSDIKGEMIEKTRKYVVLTQHHTGEDTELLRLHYPKAYRYLTEHAAYFDNRKSSIYKKRPRFCLFGIGDYSFKRYKIVISGLNKRTVFSLAPIVEDKAVMCDDTCYFIGFDSYAEAKNVLEVLNSKLVQAFLGSICFREDKRVVNKDLLMRIDIGAAMKLLKAEHKEGLTHEAL